MVLLADVIAMAETAFAPTEVGADPQLVLGMDAVDPQTASRVPSAEQYLLCHNPGRPPDLCPPGWLSQQVAAEAEAHQQAPCITIVLATELRTGIGTDVLARTTHVRKTSEVWTDTADDVKHRTVSKAPRNHRKLPPLQGRVSVYNVGNAKSECSAWGALGFLPPKWNVLLLQEVQELTTATVFSVPKDSDPTAIMAPLRLASPVYSDAKVVSQPAFDAVPQAPTVAEHGYTFSATWLTEAAPKVHSAMLADAQKIIADKALVPIFGSRPIEDRATLPAAKQNDWPMWMADFDSHKHGLADLLPALLALIGETGAVDLEVAKVALLVQANGGCDGIVHRDVVLDNTRHYTGVIHLGAVADASTGVNVGTHDGLYAEAVRAEPMLQNGGLLLMNSAVCHQTLTAADFPRPRVFFLVHPAGCTCRYGEYAPAWVRRRTDLAPSAGASGAGDRAADASLTQDVIPVPPTVASSLVHPARVFLATGDQPLYLWGCAAAAASGLLTDVMRDEPNDCPLLGTHADAWCDPRHILKAGGWAVRLPPGQALWVRPGQAVQWCHRPAVGDAVLLYHCCEQRPCPVGVAEENGAVVSERGRRKCACLTVCGVLLYA
jgi:hypothetical protein